MFDQYLKTQIYNNAYSLVRLQVLDTRYLIQRVFQSDPKQTRLEQLPAPYLH